VQALLLLLSTLLLLLPVQHQQKLHFHSLHGQ
jgi:hypothetical protein